MSIDTKEPQLVGKPVEPKELGVSFELPKIGEVNRVTPIESGNSPLEKSLSREVANNKVGQDAPQSQYLEKDLTKLSAYNASSWLILLESKIQGTPPTN